MLYAEYLRPKWWFETYVARSKDLVDWKLSPHNPVITLKLTMKMPMPLHTSKASTGKFRITVNIHFYIMDEIAR